MLEPMKKASDDFEKLGKNNYDVIVRSYGETFQAIAERWTDLSKQSFEDAIRAWQQMISGKSPHQLLRIQSDYAKKAYDDWLVEMSKLKDMYSSVTQDGYEPAQRLLP